MDRVFLDANVLFSAAYRPVNGLLPLWALSGTPLLASPTVLREATDALARKRPARIPDLATLAAVITLVADPPTTFALPGNVVLPPKDRPVMAAAIAGAATHLLTGDQKHFGPYFGRTIGGVLVLLPADYLLGRSPGP